jgi:DNA-binding transcriptional MerR regulator
MDTQHYLIDELCRLSGFTRRTVRYYVQAGLVDPPAGRGRGGYYSELQVGQLARIRVLQEQGYRLEAIRDLLSGKVGSEEPAEAAPRARAAGPVPTGPGLPSPAVLLRTGAGPKRAAWTRISVAPGVELHMSAEAESRLGPAVAAALDSLRSIIEHEGGSNE